MGPATRVLFIGGEGRSGSTVLERLIADHPGTCPVGELKNLFERGIGHAELCGCGSPVPVCDLWSEVGRRLVGGWDTAAGRELVEFFTAVNNRLRLPRILTGRGPMVDRARSVLADLYPTIAELTGSAVIVDSSKHPGWAFLLADAPGIDLRVVHLVRHPSGVVHSWGAPVVRPHAGDGIGDRVMPAHSPLEVAVRWDLFNALFRRLARRTPTVVIRYEDYVDHTEPAIRACLDLVGIEFVPGPARLATGHGIAGNPSRFTAEVSRIARDDQWVTGLSEPRHLFTSAVTWPVRREYGYKSDRSAPVGPFPPAGRRAPAPG